MTLLVVPEIDRLTYSDPLSGTKIAVFEIRIEQL